MNKQTQIAKAVDPLELVAEFDKKKAAIPALIADFYAAKVAAEMGSSVFGCWGGQIFSRAPDLSEREMLKALTVSAWKFAYGQLNLDSVAPASERKKWQLAFENPAEFTLENLMASFGKYAGNQRQHILRGLAEAFCELDPAYRSHSKVKIGVKGLPKRIILSRVENYGSYGYERLRDVLNALRALRGLPNLTGQELADFKEGRAVNAEDLPRFDPAASYRTGKMIQFAGKPYIATGFIDPAQTPKFTDESMSGYGFREVKRIFPELGLKLFANGNGHLSFDPATLREINLALAEFYGEVLPDAPAGDDLKPRASTAVSKDLAFYWTPEDVLKRVCRNIGFSENMNILEPSCGDGRILDYIRSVYRVRRATGVEYDRGRAQQARDKGHSVMCANFLEVRAEAQFDLVIMNPPFAGQHWKKHMIHARKFLKTGNEKRWLDGSLVCILPATAHYDGHLKDLLGFEPEWTDLPVGSFAEAGTNVPTGFITIGPER